LLVTTLRASNSVGSLTISVIHRNSQQLSTRGASTCRE
jgi:hypothetical protein